jgi:phosphopantothenoylcysteine decarboxylase/phosphopantothenate--cysteine ligase
MNIGPTDTTNSVQGKKILVCVTGGIAAYKVIEVVRTLAQMGADVRVIMTPSAQKFVGPQTFASLSGNKVLTEVFDDSPDAPHVELARGAGLALVAPATANSLAKLALGIADDLVGSTLLMIRCPLLVAPAMHTEMWEHPATQENVATLEARGAEIVGPASGALMSGDTGAGRLVEPEDLVSRVLAALARGATLEGKSVVVTAGGTQEPIDAVRFIGNRSSGLMGIEIAEAARARGAKVTMIAGPSVVGRPAGVDVVDVQTAAEMREAVLQLATGADIIIKAAAVADFKPDHSTEIKLKKAEGPPDVVLVPTPDILAELGADPSLRNPNAILVGFAAETEADPTALAELAEEKRRSKGADVIVANDVGSPDSGFGVRTNRAVIAGPDGVTDVGLVTKEALAEALIENVSELLEGRRFG